MRWAAARAVVALGVGIAAAGGAVTAVVHSGSSPATAGTPAASAAAPVLAAPQAAGELNARLAYALRIRVDGRQARRARITAHLVRPALLRASPGGRRLARIGMRTTDGAQTVLAAGDVRPGWVGVRAAERKDGRLAWVRADAVRLEPVRTLLIADLSARQVILAVDDHAVMRLPVGIGRPGTRTPKGRFGVTDRLTSGVAGAYGCCILPLTAHQPHLPAGWTGGTLVALHGTPDPGDVGRELSAGCLRMRDEDIRRLLPRVPLGTTMIVRA